MGLELATTPSVRGSLPDKDFLSGLSAPSIIQVVTFASIPIIAQKGGARKHQRRGAVYGSLDQRAQSAAHLEGALHFGPERSLRKCLQIGSMRRVKTTVTVGTRGSA